MSPIPRAFEMMTADALGWPLTEPLNPESAGRMFLRIQMKLWKAFKVVHKRNVIHVDPDELQTCLEYLKAHHTSWNLLWKSVYLVFQYFEMYKHQGMMPMIADWFYFLVFDTFYIQLVFGKEPSVYRENRDRFPSILSDAYDREVHNCFWKLMRMPYRNDRTEPVSADMDIVWKVAVHSDSHGLLPMFLRQGVLYVPPSSSPEHFEYCSSVLKHISKFSDAMRQEMLLTVEVKDILKYKFNSEEPEKKRRIFTVFRAMDVVQSKMHILAFSKSRRDLVAKPNHIHRFRMILDTIPEPIVTVQEVRSILETVLPPAIRSRGLVDIFCKWFGRLMPESKEPKAPRSLRHLSLCQVREGLRKVGNYPYGVYFLNLPETIKEDLLLEQWYSIETLRREFDKLTFNREDSPTSVTAQSEIFGVITSGQAMLRKIEENFQRENEPPEARAKKRWKRDL